MFKKIFILSLLLTVAVLPSVQAKTFTVDSLLDLVDRMPGDGTCLSGLRSGCTLRAAIMEANAYPGRDTIRFSITGTFALTRVGRDDTAAMGDLDITEEVNIYGTSGVIIDASSIGDRIFDIRGAYVVNLRDVTLQYGGGTTTNSGGGIYSNGATLTIRDVTIQNCTATNGGGLYMNGGTVSVDAGYNMSFTLNTATNSGGAIFNNDGVFSVGISFVPITTAADFTSNTAASYGGAIYASSSASMTLRNSIFANNSSTAGFGGAIDNSGTLTVNSSDFHGNTAFYYGGGIFIGGGSTILTNDTISGNTASVGGGIATQHGNLTLNSVTITDNTANSGGGGIGVFSFSGTRTFRNTIIAGNHDTSSAPTPDCYAVYTSDLISADYNIVGITGSECAFTAQPHDQVGTDALPLDPELDPLADNGGVTETHALQATSPALNAGNPAGCTDGTSTLTTDQRGTGYARTVGTACDIGAYEQQ